MLRSAPSSTLSVAAISAALTATVAVPLALDANDPEPVLAIASPTASEPVPSQPTPLDAEVAGVVATPTDIDAETPPSEQAEPSARQEEPAVTSEPLPDAPETADSPPPTVPSRGSDARPDPEPTTDSPPTPPAGDTNGEPGSTPTTDGGPNSEDDESPTSPPSTDLIATVVGGSLTPGVPGPLDVRIENTGSEVAPDVALQINIEGADIVAVSIDDPKWRCTSTPGAISCAGDGLRPGNTISAELEVEPTNTEMNVEVAVSHGLTEDTPSDNTVQIWMEIANRAQGGSLVKA